MSPSPSEIWADEAHVSVTATCQVLLLCPGHSGWWGSGGHTDHFSTGLLTYIPRVGNLTGAPNSAGEWA